MGAVDDRTLKVPDFHSNEVQLGHRRMHDGIKPSDSGRRQFSVPPTALNQGCYEMPHVHGHRTCFTLLGGLLYLF